MNGHFLYNNIALDASLCGATSTASGGYSSYSFIHTQHRMQWKSAVISTQIVWLRLPVATEAKAWGLVNHNVTAVSATLQVGEPDVGVYNIDVDVMGLFLSYSWEPHVAALFDSAYTKQWWSIEIVGSATVPSLGVFFLAADYLELPEAPDAPFGTQTVSQVARRRTEGAHEVSHRYGETYSVTPLHWDNLSATDADAIEAVWLATNYGADACMYVPHTETGVAADPHLARYVRIVSFARIAIAPGDRYAIDMTIKDVR